MLFEHVCDQTAIARALQPSKQEISLTHLARRDDEPNGKSMYHTHTHKKNRSFDLSARFMQNIPKPSYWVYSVPLKSDTLFPSFNIDIAPPWQQKQGTEFIGKLLKFTQRSKAIAFYIHARQSICGGLDVPKRGWSVNVSINTILINGSSFNMRAHLVHAPTEKGTNPPSRKTASPPHRSLNRSAIITFDKLTSRWMTLTN